MFVSEHFVIYKERLAVLGSFGFYCLVFLAFHLFFKKFLEGPNQHHFRTWYMSHSNISANICHCGHRRGILAAAVADAADKGGACRRRQGAADA